MTSDRRRQALTYAVPVIETASLTLRPIAEADFERLWSIWQEEPVREHLSTRPTTLEQFRSLFEYMLGMATVLGMWSVFDRESSALIGRCGFHEFGRPDLPEIAYLLTAAHWGRGLATEMAMAALRYGFEDRAWPRIVAETHPLSVRSQRVLQKIGMTFVEAITLPVEEVPALLFEQTEDRWLVGDRV
jgi:RimJ/RimL family protein N-acetyltransferase